LLTKCLTAFSKLKGQAILVHGGGKLATEMAASMGIEQTMVEGRRITDAETLKIVTMVYAGYINKNIVAQLQGLGVNAIGLTGADGNLVSAHKRTGTTIDYGFVGDVDGINATFITQLLGDSKKIVVAPITHDGKKGLVLLDQIRTIDKGRLVKRLGAVSTKTLGTSLNILQGAFTL
jgi:acetylglutamate kinase